MQTFIFEGILEALSSISHGGGESCGTTSKLRREKFVQPDGSVEEVPTLSGNGIRGILRDRGMLHMCRTLGYGVSADGTVKGLSLPAFHFLFGGGSLTAVSGKAIDLEAAREIRRLIPLISVFGGAMGNAILPGKLKINKGIPVCLETAHLLPERYTSGTLQSCWDLTQEEMYTRRDDAKNLHLRGVLDDAARHLVEQGETESVAAAAAVVEETGQKQQMLYHIETFCAGTRFYWKVVLEDPTEIEFEAFLVTLAEFIRVPYIGGRNSAGMGELRLHFDGWHKIDTRLEPETTTQPSRASGKAYLDHLAANQERIRSTLGAIV
jgi:CRISPR type IV-associated protein Csf2